MGKDLQIGQRSASLVCFHALQSTPVSILLHKGYDHPPENKQGRCLLTWVTFLKLPLTKRQQRVSPGMSVIPQNQGWAEGVSPRQPHPSGVRVYSAFCRALVKQNHGVALGLEGVQEPAQQTERPWLPGGMNAATSAQLSFHFSMFICIFLFLSPPPRPPHEAGLLVGCGGRRCETAEACVWAALLWVSLCVSALRALGRADGSGWQRVSV